MGGTRWVQVAGTVPLAIIDRALGRPAPFKASIRMTAEGRACADRFSMDDRGLGGLGEPGQNSANQEKKGDEPHRPPPGEDGNPSRAPYKHDSAMRHRGPLRGILRPRWREGAVPETTRVLAGVVACDRFVVGAGPVKDRQVRANGVPRGVANLKAAMRESAVVLGEVRDL